VPSNTLGGAFNCYQMLEEKNVELNENNEEINETQLEELKMLSTIICNVILREIEKSNHEK